LAIVRTKKGFFMSNLLHQDDLFNTVTSKLLILSENVVISSEAVGKGLPVQILDEFNPHYAIENLTQPKNSPKTFPNHTSKSVKNLSISKR